MTVEQRQLLMTVNDIDGVVDVERDRARRIGIAGAVDVDHGVGQAHHLAQGRRIFPARDGRLRAQVDATVWQPPAGQLEAGIGAQIIEVVSVLVATRDRQHAGAQDVLDAVPHQTRIAWVDNQRRECLGNTDTTLGRRQQHHAAVGCDAPTIECCNHFLAFNGWETERQRGIFRHGGCGSRSCVDGMASTPNSVNAINALRDTRQRIPAMT